MDKARFMLELILLVALGLSTYVGIDNVKDKSADVMEDVGESVYSVSNFVGRGTAWAAKTKSGKTVLVTNAHVCDSSVPLMFTVKDGEKHILRVLEKDSKHDICLLSAPPNAVPLELADSLPMEEQVYAVGFPLIDFMSSSRGVVKGYIPVEVPYNTPVSECHGQKFFVFTSPMRMPDGQVKEQTVCIFKAIVLTTTIPTDGGASGSPILNKDDEVVGMVMLRMGSVSWAEGVPLSAIKEFLYKN